MEGRYGKAPPGRGPWRGWEEPPPEADFARMSLRGAPETQPAPESQSRAPYRPPYQRSMGYMPMPQAGPYPRDPRYGYMPVEYQAPMGYRQSHLPAQYPPAHGMMPPDAYRGGWGYGGMPPPPFMHGSAPMGRTKLTEDQVPRRALELATNPMYHDELVDIIQTTQNPSLHFLILSEVMSNNWVDLFKHPLGHSVVLSLMNHLPPAELQKMIATILDAVVDLAHHKCGCRVVQRAVTKAATRDVIRLTEKLSFHALSLVKSPHGNHVLQRCVEKLPSDQLSLLVTPLLVDFFSVAAHMYGCRVIQRVVDRYCRDPISVEDVERIIDMIIKNCTSLVKEQFGNYVIQHMLEQGTDEMREKLVDNLGPQIVALSQQKFASNVMERCLTHANAKQRRRLVEVILDERLILRDGQETSAIVAMSDDPFANYVVQKMIDVADKDQRLMVVDVLIAHVDDLNKSASGRHVVAKLHKEQVFRDQQLQREVEPHSPISAHSTGSPDTGVPAWQRQLPADSPLDPTVSSPDRFV